MKVTADLDHYYFKDLYQVFCLSLYNFVPSCQICNSRLKGVKIKGIKNPYIDQINYTNFRFEVKIRNDTKLESVFGSNCDDLDIKIIHDEEYKNHIEIFQLENLYNSHKNIAAEILLKKQAYNNSYSELMLNYFEELNFNEMKKNIFLYGVELDENNFHKRPLSKFIFDLVNNDN
ncbi:hypothetical protein MKY22_08635 [Exiguobacterium sp. FSL W8-0210]|uniref:hypothetical protein n=1 Tax=Exiguobacterium sp. FSL W8-0210 TaxID=2921598 RepID=UPI0030F58762